MSSNLFDTQVSQPGARGNQNFFFWGGESFVCLKTFFCPMRGHWTNFDRIDIADHEKSGYKGCMGSVMEVKFWVMLIFFFFFIFHNASRNGEVSLP